MTSKETLNCTSSELTMYQNIEETSRKKTFSSTGCLKSKNGKIILEKEKSPTQMGRVHNLTFQRPQKGFTMKEAQFCCSTYHER